MPAFPAEYAHAKQEGVQFHWNTTVAEITPNAVDNLRCDLVIKAIGQSRFRDLGEINRETGQTKYPKYFAGGDLLNGGREVVDAVADGKRAARGIAKWLT